MLQLPQRLGRITAMWRRLEDPGKALPRMECGLKFGRMNGGC